MANKEAYADPEKRHAMDQILTLLQGTLEARGKVLVKLNVGEDNLDAVIAMLPSMKSPTVSKLFGEDGYAVETVVPKAVINTLIPALKDHGATDIIELPHVQDHPLARMGTRIVTGVVAAFDEHRGLGEIKADGAALPVPLHADRRRHPRHRGRGTGRIHHRRRPHRAGGRRRTSEDRG